MATTTTSPSERKATNTTTKVSHIGAPPPEPEHLPCPRCDSTNTKFCYYNNYNFSQPRHFCKSCRRYWTHGGTLRDIPIGGGTRKNAKRSRNNNNNNIVSANSNNVSATNHQHTSVFALPGHHHEFRHVGLVETSGSFTSLLSSNGFWGFEDLGFGLGRGVWPFHGMVENGGGGGGGTWQIENGQGHGFVGVSGNNG